MKLNKITELKFVGCRINCYIMGIGLLGFSIPIRGWVNPNIQDTKLWRWKIPIKIMETKYHFEMDDKVKLLSFSLMPNRSNTNEVYDWLQKLDGKTVEIIKPYKVTNYWFPKSYFGEIYMGEIYPEEPGVPSSHGDYRDRVIV